MVKKLTKTHISFSLEKLPYHHLIEIHSFVLNKYFTLIGQVTCVTFHLYRKKSILMSKKGLVLTVFLSMKFDRSVVHCVVQIVSYSVFVMCVCYNLILYYRLTVSNIMYLKKKNLKYFYTTHIHYRTVNIDNYILQLSNV